MNTVVRSNFLLIAIIGMLVCTGSVAVSQNIAASNSSSATGDVGRLHFEITSDDGSTIDVAGEALG
jgi:hypothetical protein